MQTTAKTRRIVIQGVRGAFHEIAARQLFGEDACMIPALSFAELFVRAADPAQADAAVLAIENSIAGSILGNYNLLQNSGLHITGEVFLPIRQNLLTLPGTGLEDIREVHSHPMALAQCSGYLEQFPHWRLVESADTAESAARIAREQSRHLAAIGSTLAAELYGLQVQMAAIETNPVNFTRFLALKRHSDTQSIPGANKASVCFSAPHQPGSLSRILAMLAADGANLTKIQSVPLPGKIWEYRFFLDFTVRNGATLPATLRLLDVMSSGMKVLGIYRAENCEKLES